MLRLRSDVAGDGLATGFAALGAEVADAVVCRNEPVPPAELPPFDAAFFASASAVRTFFAIASAEKIAHKQVAVMGGPTLAELDAHAVGDAIAPSESTVAGALLALACGIISKEIQS
jgi:uroporphyrinogen-III synthase